MKILTRHVIVLALLATAVVVTPLAATGKEDNPVRVWMATSNSEPAVGNLWGRLVMKDGMLTFSATSEGWQIALADIRRAAMSAQSDKLIQIDTVRDETFYIAILGQNMVVESPRSALDLIRRAQRAPLGRR
jgi:hypothetical protein